MKEVGITSVKGSKELTSVNGIKELTSVNGSESTSVDRRKG